jgi:hypothetical protein
MAQSKILPLPLELLEWIASFLDVQSYHKFRRVSKQTRTINPIPYLQFNNFIRSYRRARLNMTKLDDFQFMELIQNGAKGVELALQSPQIASISHGTLNKAFQYLSDHNSFSTLYVLVSFYQNPNGEIPFDIKPGAAIDIFIPIP